MTLIAWSPPAEAREGAVSISARTLPDALAELAREEGVSIGTEGSLPRARTPRIAGATTVAEALERLLAGTDLVARQVGPAAWRIERRPPSPAREGAAPASSRATEQVESPPIVVTATKRPQTLSDAPVAISVVRMREGEDRDAGRDSAWAVSQVEGVALSGQGAGRNRMFLRGVADSPFNGESQSTVAVLLDDSRLTYSAPDPDIRLVDVDRVEVLKGPQGALYGTGALGGIYRIVTRRPDPSRAAFGLGAGTELLDRGGLGGSASAMANLPLVADVAALRLVGYGTREPGWIDTGDRQDSNSGTVLGFRAGVGVEPGAHWRADATAFGQWLNLADSGYSYAADSRRRGAQLAEPHDNDLHHLSLRAEHEGPVGLVAASGITWQEVRDRYDATENAAGFGLIDPTLLDDERHYRTWDSEVRLTGAVGALDWLAGLSHVEARQITATTLRSASASPVSLQGDRRILSDSAAFGEATVALSPSLDLRAGGRLFRTHMQDTRQAGGPNLVLSRTKLGATPAFAFSWQPRRTRLVYLRYGSAFRQGGSSLSGTGQIQALAGDELGTIEAGWRETFDQSVLDIGIYYSRWENVQSDTLGSNGLLATRNAGNARIVAMEASFSGSPARGWTLDAGAAWQSALLVRNETGLELDDRRLPSVPAYTLRTALSRSWPVGHGEARVGANVRYVGPARLSFQPELDLPSGNYLESALEAQMRFGTLALTLEINNPLGLTADTFPFGNPLRATFERQHTPQRPASGSLQLHFAF